MANFYVSYRGEFGASVEAENKEEAISKFYQAKIETCGELWSEFFEVYEDIREELEDE